jgi:hypothetical protein
MIREFKAIRNSFGPRLESDMRHIDNLNHNQHLNFGWIKWKLSVVADTPTVKTATAVLSTEDDNTDIAEKILKNAIKLKKYRRRPK